MVSLLVITELLAPLFGKVIVMKMTIAGQRFRDYVPAAKNRRGINTRCYEGRSLQTNSAQGAFP
jgi:hypothetical protein